MNLILGHFWHNSVDKPRNQSPWPHYFMLCEKKKGSVAKVKSGKRENHMVVDAKQGYNLFLMWEETSEFWHKQQPTFVLFNWLVTPCTPKFTQKRYTFHLYIS